MSPATGSKAISLCTPQVQSAISKLLTYVTLLIHKYTERLTNKSYSNCCLDFRNISSFWHLIACLCFLAHSSEIMNLCWDHKFRPRCSCNYHSFHGMFNCVCLTTGTLIKQKQKADLFIPNGKLFGISYQIYQQIVLIQTLNKRTWLCNAKYVVLGFLCI